MKPFLLKLLGISKQIWAFIAPLLTDAAKLLLPVAEQYVLEVANEKLSNLEKKNMAMAKLRDYAVSAGLPTPTSLLDTIIQAAFTKLKADGQVQ